MRFLYFVLFSLFSLSAFANCQRPWKCEVLDLTVPYTTLTEIKFARVKIRAGVYPHSGKFRGNILYFQGLGDSMLNHDPLFKKLSKKGHRVIAFDYMGQGGSTGKMDNTRIEYISWIGERVWSKLALDTESFPQKTIIGWSIGGLAAFLAASQGKADRVILMAPGIAPRKIIGERMEMTLDSFTSDVYFDRMSNPHKEGIIPDSHLKVPAFGANLLITAEKIKDKIISPSVKGLVLLTGPEDTYVNAERTEIIIDRNASHFFVKKYRDALHELDNERSEIRVNVHREIINFLDSDN